MLQFAVVIRINASVSSVDRIPHSLLLTMTDSRSWLDNDSNMQRQHERELTSEEKEYAAIYLEETDNNRESAIAEMKCWIRENDDLCARTGKNREIRIV